MAAGSYIEQKTTVPTINQRTYIWIQNRRIFVLPSQFYNHQPNTCNITSTSVSWHLVQLYRLFELTHLCFLFGHGHSICSLCKKHPQLYLRLQIVLYSDSVNHPPNLVDPHRVSYHISHLSKFCHLMDKDGIQWNNAQIRWSVHSGAQIETQIRDRSLIRSEKTRFI